MEKHRHSFLMTGPGQVLLTVLVVGLTVGLIVYSASLSFARVRPPRRLGSRDADERTVLQGNIRFVEGKLLQADSGATLLVWPQGWQGNKLSLTATELKNTDEPRRIESLTVVPVNSVGAYRLEAQQLPLPASLYNLLAISDHVQRADPPLVDDLQTLREQFQAPEELLNDRQYVIRAVFLDSNVTKEMDFVFSASPSPMPASTEDEPTLKTPTLTESAASSATNDPPSTP